MLVNVVTNPDAPLYEPEKWNDLGIDSNQNVENFFQYLRKNHFDIVSGLQAASLLSLGNIVALADDISDYPYLNQYAHRIKSLLQADDILVLQRLVKKFFSSQQTRANCYAYAVNFQKSYPGSKPDPGGKTKEFRHGLYDDFLEAVTAGAIEDGLILAGDVLPDEKSGFYRVAVAIKQGAKESTYHWLREDFNSNTWSHKSGHGPVQNTDIAGNVITNPCEAELGKYQVKRFFYVPRGGIRPSCLDAG